MGDSPDKIQWHPAFYAATGLELHEDMERLELKSEYNLSKEPIRIDLLIIKNDESIGKIKNEIGHIMRKYNVIEYKSPEDSMTIDDFYKTIGYACLYKGYGNTVNEIPENELSVSLFREVYPEKLFLTLCEQGHKIKERYPGIYYVTGNLPFPVQIVVTKQLKREKHRCLRVLSANADREDVEAFLSEADKMDSPRERNNIDAVLQVSVRANYELYQEIRRKSTMCEALRELMKDEIEHDVNEAKEKAMREGRAAGLAEGRAEGRAEGKKEEKKEIAKKLLKLQMPIEQISEITSLTGDEIKNIDID